MNSFLLKAGTDKMIMDTALVSASETAYAQVVFASFCALQLSLYGIFYIFSNTIAIVSSFMTFILYFSWFFPFIHNAFHFTSFQHFCFQFSWDLGDNNLLTLSIARYNCNDSSVGTEILIHIQLWPKLFCRKNLQVLIYIRFFGIACISWHCSRDWI